jgi:Flp pilus assembly protein TadD
MKICIAQVALIASLVTAPAAFAQSPGTEIGYERGSLGFEALMANDNHRALNQILADKSTSPNDPARLINLGRAHARLGDKERARQAFLAAANCKEEFDLVLSTGQIMNSRKVAVLALKSLGQ